MTLLPAILCFFLSDEKSAIATRVCDHGINLTLCIDRFDVRSIDLFFSFFNVYYIIGSN